MPATITTEPKSKKLCMFCDELFNPEEKGTDCAHDSMSETSPHYIEFFCVETLMLLGVEFVNAYAMIMGENND